MGILLFAVLHAAARSVALEMSRHRRPKIIASDGFVDEDCSISSGDGGEEETLVFRRDTHNLRMRSSSSARIPGLIRRRSRANFDIPMAAPAVEIE